MDGVELGGVINASPELAGTRLIMMTSLGQRDDPIHLEQSGFSVTMTKPIRQAQLLECLVQAKSRTAPSTDRHAGPIAFRPSVGEEVKVPVRILLAEDNLANQKVALAILNKLGHDADIVADGWGAVKILERIPYDLVLMDCQMPEMDGYQATAVIRDPHSAVLNHRVPIIALTAHAMQSDREKCLQAGMDDYLPKPLRPGELSKVLDRWLPNTREPDILTPASEETVSITAVMGDADREIFHEADLVERLMGDQDLALVIVAGFLEDMHKQFVSLHAYVEAADHAAVQRLSHTIKGAAANVGASLLREAAHEMEKVARTGDMEMVGRLHPNMEWRFTQLVEVLQLRLNASRTG
jgi:two-component system sensor histidine kinase/response regulator